MTGASDTLLRGSERVRGLVETFRVPLLLSALLVMAANSVAIQTFATDPGPWRQVPRLLSLAVAVVVIWAARVKVEWIAAGILVAALVGGVVSRNSDQLSYVFVVIIAVALTAVSERRAIALAAIACVGAFALVFVLLAVGVSTDSVVEIRSRRTFGVASIGFIYNVVFGACALVCTWATRFTWPLRYGALAVTLAVATWFYLETDARAGYLSFLAFVVFSVVPIVVWRSRVVCTLLALAPVLFLAAAAVLAGLSDNPTANSILSNRPIFWGLLVDDLSVRDVLLSRSVKALDTSNIVDNSYLHLLVGGGVAVTALFIVLHFKAIAALARAGMNVELALIASLALYFNMESILVRPDLVFIIFYWHLLMRGWALSRQQTHAPADMTDEQVPA